MHRLPTVKSRFGTSRAGPFCSRIHVGIAACTKAPITGVRSFIWCRTARDHDGQSGIHRLPESQQMSTDKRARPK